MSFFLLKRTVSVRLVAVLLAIISSGLSATEQSFIDPLHLPARHSDRAASKLLLDAAVLNSNRLVAVGEHGTIVFSDDKGGSWQQARVPVSVNLTAVFFADEESGWVAGHDGVILGTKDAGQTWVKLFDGNMANKQIIAVAERRLAALQERHEAAAGSNSTLQVELELAEDALADAEAGAAFGPARPLFSLWFENARQGFAAGSFGQLFQTGDGGANWHYIGDRLDNPEGFHYNAITRAPSGKLLIAGEGGVLHSSADGGNTWRRHETGYNGQLYGVLAFNEEMGDEILLAYGFGGRIFVSRNAGSDWSELDREVRANIVSGFLSVNGSPRLLNSAGQILGRDDAGRRFVPLAGLQSRGVTSVTRLSDSSLLLTGVNGVQIVTWNEAK